MACSRVSGGRCCSKEAAAAHRRRKEVDVDHFAAVRGLHEERGLLHHLAMGHAIMQQPHAGTTVTHPLTPSSETTRSQMPIRQQVAACKAGSTCLVHFGQRPCQKGALSLLHHVVSQFLHHARPTRRSCSMQQDKARKSCISAHCFAQR